EKKIVIEHRNPSEVTTILGRLEIAPKGTEALNPAFDVTPPELVTSIITEKGVAWPPYIDSLRRIIGSQ
ncbi:MAG: S-methyl-5-thioribose-1-phosphate isomerase, partial [Fervidicoccaceae archaeon]